MSPTKRSIARHRAALALLVVLSLPLTSAAPLGGDGVMSKGPAPSSVTPAAGADRSSKGPTGPARYTPATPLDDSPEPVVEVRAGRPGQPPITKVVNDPRCGPGSTSVSSAPGIISCFHNSLDVLPPVAQPAAQAPKVAPVCMGNGVNGPRIQLIYMFVEGQRDRTAEVVPRILNEIVPRMEGVFRETSKSQGREIGMRLHMPGCKLTVDTVMIDAENGRPDDPFVMAPRINDALTRAGFGSSDRKFSVWFDGGNGLTENGKTVGSACGIAPAYTAVLEQGLNPTPANTSNVGWHNVMISGEAAITFRYGSPILGDAPPPPYPGAPQQPECWGRGAMGAHTETHELLHLIGAVGWSAPNWNGADSHCLDDIDIMCQVGANGVPKFLRCNTPVEQLDCGGDDYFNARPQAGSYLSRAWNTANSRFLGEAVLHDAVPVEIPRP